MRDALAAEPWADSRLGLVGRITSVEQIGIRALLAAGIVPVIAPTASGLNVNADNAAAAVAGALRRIRAGLPVGRARACWGRAAR